MIFWPAIDIMNGRCVRLLRGEKNARTDYAGIPADIAASFAKDGADGIHLVDLDGAFEGKRKNMETIKAVASGAGIPVEVGGGIRSIDDMKALFDAGVFRVILGTAAIKGPDLVTDAIREFGPDKIVLGIDAKEGFAAVKGWTEKTNIRPEDLALKMKDRGIENLIYTEISRDGTLKGPDIEGTKAIAKATGLKVIASGGISSLIDIGNLIKVESYGITGFITGKAIYEGWFTVSEAASLVRGAREMKVST